MQKEVPNFTNYNTTVSFGHRTSQPQGGNLRRRDIHTIVKVLKYVADKSMEDTEFGRKMLEDIHPTISTELYIINDFFRQRYGDI